ncbi:MAG: hypothetical protein AAF889_01430 [Cyanobacteria bacterium P01_D01_bin.73]
MTFSLVHLLSPLAVSQQALMDGIFVGIAVTLGVAAFGIMFNGALSKVRDK